MADIKTISEGLAVKIQEIFGPLLGSAIINKDIIYCPEEIAMRLRAEATAGANKPKTQQKEEYKLEFISFWLESADFSWERNRSPLARDGINIGSTDNNNVRYRFVKAVPVDLVYSITLWTLSRQRVDDFIREYCFIQHNNPQIEFYLEGDKKFEIDFFIRPGSKQEDSFGKSFKEGKYWKPQISFNVEGWLIKDVPINFAKTVNLDIYASDSLTNRNDNVHVVDETYT